MNTIAILRQAETEAHDAYRAAYVDPNVPDDERRRLRRAWKLAAETFLLECDARSVAKSQVLQAAVEGAER